MNARPITASYGRFFNHGRQGEWDRLATLAAIFDPFTETRLRHLPLPEHDGIFLEIGPGTGTVAQMLRDIWCPAELVLLDRDPELLAALAPIATRTVLADLTDPSTAPGSFDVIHARMVLWHLPDPRSVLDRLVSWLRPGGWLVVSDALDSTSLTTDAWSIDTSLLMRRCLELAIGSSYTWPMHYPVPLRDAGLSEVGVAVDVPEIVAGGPVTRFLEASVRALVATAEAQGHDMNTDHVRQTLDQAPPLDLVAISPIGQVTAWGRKPV